MKKTVSILLLSGLFLLAACGQAPAPAAPTPPAAPAPTPTVTAPPAAPATAVPTAEAPAENAPADTFAGDGVDVDLTVLSSTMVYSEVYNMMRDPDTYLGMTIKVSGSLSTYEVSGRQCFACVVADALACCAQGLEFELDESYRYPDDYPEPGAAITLIGTFGMYQEEYNGNTYLFLILQNARLV